MDEMDEVIGEFLIESQENLDRLDEEFVLLEQDPSSTLTIAAIFRTIHTIKGTSGFLGYGRLERLTHQGENLLSKLRDGKFPVTEAMTSALLSMVDAVRSMLTEIEQHRNDGQNDYADLVEILSALANGGAAPSPAPGDTPVRSGHPALLTSPKATEADDDHVTASPATVVDQPKVEHAPAKVDSSIRVEVGLLDHLMNLVGELVLSRNQLLAHAQNITDSGFAESTQRLNFITSELQESVMKTRMQPVSTVWSKFPRIVRDLAIACGKKVRLEMEGAETELDKTIIEAIKDPLTHIVRNSIDHGIERAEVRAERGKPAEGTLLLRAYHEGGQVIMEIADDGGGIDPVRIRAKAIEKGLVTAEQANALTDHEAVCLVFAPGFSTAEQVTNVSGRGVGMDVVRTNIEKIGGSLDVQSVVGQGTTLVVKIPLTLAIIPALIVGLDGARYAISQVNLVELVRIEASNRDSLERIGSSTVFRLRGKLLPVIDLRHVLQISTERGADEALNLVVLSADGRQFGAIVDEVRDTQEIVVKPLGHRLGSIDLYAGTTIMGDGAVALILDASGMARRARVSDDRRVEETETVVADVTEHGETLVVVEVGTRRLAVPIAVIDRLEEIPQSAIELAGGTEVVQYRNGLLSLVRVGSIIGVYSEAPDPLPVLVYQDGDRTVGLVVDRIIDIVDESAVSRGSFDGAYVDYSGVIGRRVTDLIDIHALVASTRPMTADLVSVGSWATDETSVYAEGEAFNV